MAFQPSSEAFDGVRRREPRLFDTDWLILRGLLIHVRKAAADLAGCDRHALDLGCGDQPYRPIFEENGIRYRGAELGGAAEIKISNDGRVDAPAGAADLVLSFQVLEHVRDLDCYLSEAKRLMRADGQLLLSTHGTWLYHPHPEDHRRWTREGLINELETRGFKVDNCEAIVGPLAFTTIIRLTAFAHVLRQVPMVGRPLAGLLAMVMNLRASFEDRITPLSVRRNNACVYLVRASIASSR